MLSKNVQQARHFRQLKTYTVGVDDNSAAKFALWFEDCFRKSHFKSYSELGQKIGVSRTTVSSLAKARPQSVTGRPSRPKRDLVIKIAKALNEDVNDALLAAGHAPDKLKGYFSRFEDLSPDKQRIAELQINAIIDALADVDQEKLNYVDE